MTANRENLRRWLLELSINAVRLAAADAKTQINAFPRFVHVASELAMTVGEALERASDSGNADVLTQGQRRDIAELSRMISNVFHTRDDTLVTDEALCSRAEWQAIRNFAAEVLKRNGWQGQLHVDVKMRDL